MPKTRRKKPYDPAMAHDRRSRDLPRNAEVAAVEVDNPLALEPGEKILALRSIRNDPLGRLHSHRQIDEAQYRGGRAFQDDWEKAERGPGWSAAGIAHPALAGLLVPPIPGMPRQAGADLWLRDG